MNNLFVCLLISSAGLLPWSEAMPTSSLNIKVDLDSPLAVCEPAFLSVTIDSNMIRKKFIGFDFGSQKLQSMAKALMPSGFRLGGTNADFLIFKPDGEESSTIDEIVLEHKKGKPKPLTNFTMSGELWDKMMTFFNQVGWSVMFDFSLFRWKNGFWDPDNAEELLKYSALKGYELDAFQLGNEPDIYHGRFNITIPPATLVKDLMILKDVLHRYPKYLKSKLFAPDATRLAGRYKPQQYIRGFIAAGGKQLVDAITFHHYYMKGTVAKIEDFYNVTVMDTFKTSIEIGQGLAKGTPICLTETSSCFHGGAKGLSDAYVAGFLWLDKLGLAAQYGVTRVYRQTFYGANYALLSPTLDPNPDYFLSVLHKRLVLGPVLNATVHPRSTELRMYAHCTRAFGTYKKGALTLAYLNTKNEALSISVSQFSSLPVDLYILTSGDSAGLRSRLVKLNGEVLKVSGSSLPDLTPKSHEGNIGLPPLSFGFIVVPDADIAACKK